MPTVREFAAQFLDHQASRTKPLTHIQQRATINTLLVPALGKLRVDQIARQHIDGLATAWAAAGNAPKTINTRLGTIRRLLSLAVEWEIIPRVPRIEFLRLGKEAPRWLADEEMTRLLDAAEPRWRSMMLVGLRTGLRIGELRGLQWGDVDLERRTLHVRRTDPGRRALDATPPKGNRDRTVPLTVESAAALAAMRPAKARADDWVWPALLKRGTETRSRARSEKGCWHALNRAARAAKLADVGWHTLRHTYASHLVMRGIPIRLVQAWLGHASVKETEKYAHLYPDHGHDAASLLDTPLACQTGAKALPAGDDKASNSG
jgi:integrase